MLHGPNLFGDENKLLAHQLLMIYGKQYENFDSLNNTNCFGPESLFGKFSKNKHGTRDWGDLLVHYFNVSCPFYSYDIVYSSACR